MRPSGYPCRLFSVGSGSKTEEAFTVIGFHDWKHATGKVGMLEKYNNCHAHKQAMITWCDFKKNVARKATIADQIDSQRNIRIQENRHYIKTVAETILLCAKQNIARLYK